jgi:hypothetical protein
MRMSRSFVVFWYNTWGFFTSGFNREGDWLRKKRIGLKNVFRKGAFKVINMKCGLSECWVI